MTSTSLEPAATPSSPQFLASAESATVPTEETEKEQVEKEKEQMVEEVRSSRTHVAIDYCRVVLEGSGGPVIPV